MRYVRKYFKTKTMIDIYYTFFYPHLIYGLEFWGHAGTSELDKILILQKKALRIILKIKPSETVVSKFAILKIIPIKMLFKFQYLLHVITMLPYIEIKKLSVDHNYETRLKVSNAIKRINLKRTKV